VRDHVDEEIINQKMMSLLLLGKGEETTE